MGLLTRMGRQAHGMECSLPSAHLRLSASNESEESWRAHHARPAQATGEGPPARRAANSTPLLSASIHKPSSSYVASQLNLQDPAPKSPASTTMHHSMSLVTGRHLPWAPRQHAQDAEGDTDSEQTRSIGHIRNRSDREAHEMVDASHPGPEGSVAFPPDCHCYRALDSRFCSAPGPDSTPY